jgi:hypothetical protein
VLCILCLIVNVVVLSMQTCIEFGVVVVDESYVLCSKFHEVIANAITSVLEAMYRTGNPLIESYHNLSLWYQSKFQGTKTFRDVNNALCLSKP